MYNICVVDSTPGKSSTTHVAWFLVPGVEFITNKKPLHHTRGLLSYKTLAICVNILYSFLVKKFNASLAPVCLKFNRLFCEHDL